MVATFFQITQYGLTAGITMSIVAIALSITGFTKLNLTEYLGCLLTGQKTGYLSFILGATSHLIFSVVFAYLYIQIVSYFELPITLKTALCMGILNTLFSGIMIKGIDTINPCVASAKIRAMNFFAYGYGISATITYVLVHIVYSVTFFALMGAPLHF